MAGPGVAAIGLILAVIFAGCAASNAESVEQEPVFIAWELEDLKDCDLSPALGRNTECTTQGDTLEIRSGPPGPRWVCVKDDVGIYEQVDIYYDPIDETYAIVTDFSDDRSDSLGTIWINESLVANWRPEDGVSHVIVPRVYSQAAEMRFQVARIEADSVRPDLGDDLQIELIVHEGGRDWIMKLDDYHFSPLIRTVAMSFGYLGETKWYMDYHFEGTDFEVDLQGGTTGDKTLPEPDLTGCLGAVTTTVLV